MILSSIVDITFQKLMQCQIGVRYLQTMDSRIPVYPRYDARPIYITRHGYNTSACVYIRLYETRDMDKKIIYRGV